MNNLNSVIIEGNLVSDCEIRDAGSTKVSAFTIATHYTYLQQDAKQKNYQENTDYFDCESWGKGFAGVAEKYLKKGVFVRVQGRLRQDSWKTEDGKTRSKVVIVADKVNFTVDKNKKGLSEAVVEGSENIEVGEQWFFVCPYSLPLKKKKESD